MIVPIVDRFTSSTYGVRSYRCSARYGDAMHRPMAVQFNSALLMCGICHERLWIDRVRRYTYSVQFHIEEQEW
jgi:hypothetical protein